MEPIRSFDQLTSHLKSLNKRKRIAVVCANDPNTEYAIARSLEEGIAEFLMIGDSAILEKYPTLKKYPQYVRTVHIEDPDEAAREAVRIVREGGADILMKGIINTDNLLHAILDKEKGLLPKGKILTHLAVMQIVVHQEIGVAFRSGRTRPHVDDGLDLLRGTAFQHHAPEFVTVYVVPVPPVDEVTPFLAGSQIVHNQNIVDARFVEPPDHGAPDEARTACYDVHGHSLKMQ